MKYTKRQQDVINLILRGSSIKQMCKKLKLAESTVKMHLGMVYKKSNVKNKCEFTLKHFTAQRKFGQSRAKA